MLVVPAQQHQHAFVDHRSAPSPHRSSSPRPDSPGSQGRSPGPDASLNALLSSLGPSMERGASEYTQSDHGSAAQQYATPQQQPSQQQQASQQQEVRSGGGASYSTSATPTSDYSVYPASARSGSFPEHLQRSYHPASNHSGSSGGMAQPTSPSSSSQQGPRARGQGSAAHLQDINSDHELPLDPTLTAPSPTYTTHSQYSPYAPPPSQDMSHGYAHPSGGLYAQPRPDWSGYGQQHGTPLTPGHHVFPQTPTSAPPHRPNQQVYSFVPIPGAQQHKRPRRRYEEIERMYKCGWNGCEKAYGTLNHLNAHVTMQSHGQKRTPEEFKEIRKEWKARKKEEEANRKAEEERQRQAAAAASQNVPADAQGGTDATQTPTSYASARGAVQLPPIGYQPSSYPTPGSASVQGSMDYGTSYIHSYQQPASPYGQPSQQMYNQPNP